MTTPYWCGVTEVGHVSEEDRVEHGDHDLQGKIDAPAASLGYPSSSKSAEHRMASVVRQAASTHSAVYVRSRGLTSK